MFAKYYDRMKSAMTLWFYRNFVNISFPKLNMLSLWGVLAFTVVFTWLTIHEEYKVFEKNFYADAQAYTQNREAELDAASMRIRKLIELHRVGSEPELREAMMHIAAAFSGDASFFTNLYTQAGEPLYVTAEPTPGSFGALAGQGGIVPGEVLAGGVRQTALLKELRFAGGFKMILGVPTPSAAELMQARKTELKRRLTRIILEFVTLAFIIFGFMLGINTIYNALLKRDVGSFLEFFSHAAKTEAVINPNTIFFAEFKKMVEYANDMVTALATHKHSLEALNLSLEDKVRQKTAALEVKNFALEKEKAFSQNLVQSQKAFIRYAIHETNTPLSVIVANLDLYTMKHGKNPYLSKIDASVKNLFSIYDDLSYLVKKDQVDYPVKRIDLCLFLQERIDFFSEVAEQAGLRFAFACGEGAHTIVFNQTKLQRIVDNNLTNAIKYTLRNETIRVDVSGGEGRVRFRIASRSQLIEDTERVFDAFYRERGSVEGFGLGLNLVKRICDEEGVAIDLRSDARETCFTYTFARDHESTAA